MVATYVFYTGIAFVMLLLWSYGGLREVVGEYLVRMFPGSPLKKGDRIDVFLDGKYNRTATITDIQEERLFIYGKIALPLDYRGRFYAVGVDTTDGSRLVYVGHRKRFKFVRAAELIRTVFRVIDDENMLPVEEETAESMEEELL